MNGATYSMYIRSWKRVKIERILLSIVGDACEHFNFSLVEYLVPHTDKRDDRHTGRGI
jgi:hypothetical protein